MEASDSLQEWQLSVARTCAVRAYCPHFGEVLAGCALRTAADVICGGSAIGTWTGYGRVSPLAASLVSLGGKGLGLGDITDVIWVAEQNTPEVQSLRCEDEALLKSLAPGAAFHSK